MRRFDYRTRIFGLLSGSMSVPPQICFIRLHACIQINLHQPLRPGQPFSPSSPARCGAQYCLTIMAMIEEMCTRAIVIAGRANWFDWVKLDLVIHEIRLAQSQNTSNYSNLINLRVGVQFLIFYITAAVPR